LPVYARDVLDVGPSGLGAMRSSVALGAVATALLLAALPAGRLPHAGKGMFFGVGVFGVAILVFGISTSFALSLAALAVMGAADMISVWVRSTVVQLATQAKLAFRFCTHRKLLSLYARTGVTSVPNFRPSARRYSSCVA